MKTDYEPTNNAERVARRQQIARDVGATREQIRDAVLSFNRRIEDRIAARAVVIAQAPAPVFMPVISEVVSAKGEPITLGSPPVGVTIGPPSPAGVGTAYPQSFTLDVIEGGGFVRYGGVPAATRTAF